jgi:hypothetical protein
MQRYELAEKYEALERKYLILEGRFKRLTRKQFPERGEISTKQAQVMRLLLKGHLVDASTVLDFEPYEFLHPNGDVDAGRLLWWLDTVNGKWVG